MWFVNIFFWSFTSRNNIFYWLKILTFHKVCFINFFFLGIVVLVLYIRIYILCFAYPRSQRFSCYLLEVLWFCNLQLSLQSFWVTGWDAFFLFVCEYPIAAGLYVEKTVLFPLNCLCNFLKNQLALFI